MMIENLYFHPLFQALAAIPPRFGHHNLLVNASGEGFSKRSGAMSLTGLRESGAEALAVAAMAVLTGSATAIHPVARLEDLGPIDLARLSRAPARFDEHDLWTLSAKTLHGLPFAAVCDRLVARGLPGNAAGEAFWLAVRGNLERFADVDGWWAVVQGDIAPVLEDPDIIAAAARLLPPEPWGPDTWSAWTGSVKAETGRKGRALFHPLRLALTGRDTGPELAALLPLIGRPRVLARLSGRAG